MRSASSSSAFFYTAVVFNPEETAENLKKYGGFMPGIRPGVRTAEYLDYVLTRITVVGAAYLTLICLLPEFLSARLGTGLALGGTSLLIVVNVTMDTVAQIQSHLLAHQYEGLIKKSKLAWGSAPLNSDLCWVRPARGRGPRQADSSKNGVLSSFRPETCSGPPLPHRHPLA